MVSPWQLLISMMIALIFSAFFSASEMAFTAVNHVKLKGLIDQGNHQAKKALAIAEHYDQYSSALLFGNGVVNIFNSSVTALLSIQYIAPLLPNPALAASLSAILSSTFKRPVNTNSEKDSTEIAFWAAREFTKDIARKQNK